MDERGRYSTQDSATGQQKKRKRRAAREKAQGHSQAAVLGQCWPDHAWPSSPAPVAQNNKKQRLAAEFALPLLNEGCLLPIPVSNVTCYVYCVLQHIWQEGNLFPFSPVGPIPLSQSSAQVG